MKSVFSHSILLGKSRITMSCAHTQIKDIVPLLELVCLCMRSELPFSGIATWDSHQQAYDFSRFLLLFSRTAHLCSSRKPPSLKTLPLPRKSCQNYIGWHHARHNASFSFPYHHDCERYRFTSPFVTTCWLFRWIWTGSRCRKFFEQGNADVLAWKRIDKFHTELLLRDSTFGCFCRRSRKSEAVTWIDFVEERSKENGRIAYYYVSERVLSVFFRWSSISTKLKSK